MGNAIRNLTRSSKAAVLGISVLAGLTGLAGLTILTGGCGAASGQERWNVVFVLVDTLRADHLGSYGAARDTSPHLDAFAEGAYRFPSVAAQAGCTFPSVNSLLTSRYAEHFLGQPQERRMSIPDSIPSLAEILSGQGYRTVAVSASPVVRNTPSKVNRFGGFGRGFDRFDEACMERDASCVNGVAFGALDELSTQSAPFFLYLHYWDPHDPYDPPPHAIRHFPDQPYTLPFLHNGNLWPLIRMIYADGPQWQVTPPDVAQIKTLYDEEIRYFDGRFQELLDRLDSAGLLDRTLLVFASDHGDEQLEHGEIGHCRNLAYQTILHTPLLLKIPGLPGGVRQDRVENLDIVPTLLDYLGVPTDGLTLEGKSLRPVIEDDREIHRYVFSAQGNSRVVSDGRWKLLYDIKTEQGRLFDLADDPGETRDLAAERPQEAEGLRDVLFRWIRHLEGAVGSDEALRRAKDAEDELKAVGYL